METDRTRRAQKRIRGLSMRTQVAYGPHGAFRYYETTNTTDVNIDNESTVIIESGGQYLDGTTLVTRTVHFGMPNDRQRIAYTNVLRSLIRLSTFVFPENFRSSELDDLIR